MSVFIILSLMTTIALTIGNSIFATSSERAEREEEGGENRVSGGTSDRVLFYLIAGTVLFVMAAVIYAQRSFVYDDSFISFRYARNLAEGYGLVWNRNEPPVEGYTNFLLVILLVPFALLNISLLFATRLLSIVAAFGIAYVLSRSARKYYGVGEFGSLTIGALSLVANYTFHIAMIGLETLLYAFGLLVALHLAGIFFERKDVRSAVWFGLALFLSTLTRPEGVLLGVAFVITLLIRERNQIWLALRTALIGLTVACLLPGLLYLFWKLWYFGSIFPNAFYLKASSGKWIVDSGSAAVGDFAATHWKLIILALASLIVDPRSNPQRTMSSVALGLFLLFYMRVDALMNVFNRFLYPLAPILFILVLPVICFTVNRLTSWKQPVVPKIAVAYLLLIITLTVSPDLFARDVPNLVNGIEMTLNRSPLMEREYEIGEKLSGYSGISEVSIASGDAGVIPFLTNCRHMDPVGLNDNYIARERDKELLVDYFFGVKPDIIIHPGAKKGEWIRFGHGPLGNYQSWANDVRWDDYSYAGTCRIDGGPYDLHFFVRKEHPEFSRLSRFIKTEVADGAYVPFLSSIGSYVPPSDKASIQFVPNP